MNHHPLCHKIKYEYHLWTNGKCIARTAVAKKTMSKFTFYDLHAPSPLILYAPICFPLVFHWNSA